MRVYSGFDTYAFPGFDALAALKPYFDGPVGCYLRGPSHQDQSWSGKRAQLEALGWGLLPIYVGQETVGPGSHVVTGQQGQLDGAEAAQRMAAEGFPLGSTVFLDLENGPPFSDLESAYVAGWVSAVHAGGMVAGVYASHLFGARLVNQYPAAPLWLYHVPTIARTDLTLPPSPTAPAFSAPRNVVAVQYRQNVALHAPGLPAGGLVVDLNSALAPNPSAPIPAG